jgi:hypothetical protein
MISIFPATAFVLSPNTLLQAKRSYVDLVTPANRLTPPEIDDGRKNLSGFVKPAVE